MTPLLPLIDDALTLMQRAIVLLDRAQHTMSADFLKHAISLLEEEHWATAGIQPAHRVMQ